MNEVIDAKNNQVLELVATAAVEVVNLPNPEAWANIPIALAREPWVTPAAQHQLRPQVWSTRKSLRKYLAANAELTKDEIESAARQIAAEV